MARPEERKVLGVREVKQVVQGSQPSTKRATGRGLRFVSNRALLRRHAIRKEELKILRQVAMLETVAHPEHLVIFVPECDPARRRFNFDSRMGVCEKGTRRPPRYDALVRYRLSRDGNPAHRGRVAMPV